MGMAKKKDVVLIFPKVSDSANSRLNAALPLSVLYVGTGASKKYDVHIVDMRMDDGWAATVRRLAGSGPVAVGISSMTGCQIKHGLEAARLVRSVDPKIPIVWGGVHPSIEPESTIKNEFVDYVVIGEGEKTFPELLDALASGSSIDKVAGVCFKKDGKVVRTKPREPVDLDEMVIPDYSLIDVEAYMRSEFNGPRCFQIVSSRGCPHRCGYCYTKCNHGKYRAMSAANVVKHLKYVVEKFRPDMVDISEDNFFVLKGRVEHICRGVVGAGIKARFNATCRAEYVASFSDELLRLLGEAGFEWLFIGAESGSDSVLKHISKGSLRKDAVAACRRLKDAGIYGRFSFMAGFPGERREDVIETVRLMAKLTEINGRTQILQLFMYSPYPGTALFDELAEAGFKLPSTLEDYADVTWSQTGYPWLPAEDRRLIDDLRISALFLDGRSASERYDNGTLTRILNKAYSKLFKFRIRHNLFGPMPEARAVRFVLSRMMKVVM
jgi:radical SAM superfamily enzyme YgiQ (UPF0313 family)